MANKRRISLREGRVYLDGKEIMDAVKLEAVFTPDVNESRGLKERGVSRRWLGFDITGTITEYRTTPEFTITGVQDDKGSDYYAKYGNITKTLRGVVLTGDLSLINMDGEGDVMQDEIEFGANDMV